VEAEVAARTAATAARGASTLEEAVHRFVADMPLADGVLRADVLTKVRTYLGVG